jgi:hypothetical protein
VWHIPNYRTDQRMHNYFTAIVDRITSLDEMRTRLTPLMRRRDRASDA